MSRPVSVAKHPDVAAADAVLSEGGQSALLEWAERNPAAFYRAWAEIASYSAVWTALRHVAATLDGSLTLQ